MINFRYVKYAYQNFGDFNINYCNRSSLGEKKGVVWNFDLRVFLADWPCESEIQDVDPEDGLLTVGQVFLLVLLPHGHLVLLVPGLLLLQLLTFLFTRPNKRCTSNRHCSTSRHRTEVSSTFEIMFILKKNISSY